MATPETPRHADDLDLVAACIAGDEPAWERFHATYRPLILALARRALVQRGAPDASNAAEDVAADVYAELLGNERRVLKSYAGRSSLGTWLGVITTRCAGRSARRQRRQPIASDAVPEAKTDTRDLPPVRAEGEERRALIAAQLAELGDRDRLALQLFYEGGRSYKEVAAALRLPVNRIGTLLARARARLAKTLGATFEAEPE